MTKKQWFGAKAAADQGDFLFQTFLRFVARNRAPQRPASAKAGKHPLADCGLETSWTASLNRGADLPPCRLSIHNASGSHAAMRLEPYRNNAEAGARPFDH
ncbi:MAG TPA: hypothetical protein VMU18_01760 [Rhodoblastus sp.]|nr:hypothetical protein [Rhodoblastus sp.]